MQSEGRSQLLGARIVDGACRILSAWGLGIDSRLQSLVIDSAWMDEARLLLQPLSFDCRWLVVLMCRLPDVDLLVIGEAGAEPVFEFINSVDFDCDYLVSDRFDTMTVVDADARGAYGPSVVARP